MYSSLCIINPIRFSIYIFILSSLILFQSPSSVQSISLSRLCGNFGHSCFGGNWGKRASPFESSSSSSSDLHNDEKAIHSLIDNDNISEELRLKLFQQRLRQLFRLK